MAEIEQLTPAYRVPPSRPAAGSGQGKGRPQRKPKDDDRQHEQERATPMTHGCTERREYA